MSHRVRLLLAYDGTDFSGWQSQNRGQRTIQDVIEETLSRLFDEKIRILGSGRTDAGVHALGQVAHFDTAKNPKNYKLVYALRRHLPASILVRKAWLAPPEFDAMRTAESKTYRYRIVTTPLPNPFMIRYSAWERRPLNIEKLNEFTELAIGTHDFKSFQSHADPAKTTVRTITEARWNQKGHHVFFTITGSGFLRHMVRNIVGTALWLYKNDGKPEDFSRILEAQDRQLARAPAPSHGLFLWKVVYPTHLDNKCLKI